jgi:L-gulonolactone oxidase
LGGDGGCRHARGVARVERFEWKNWAGNQIAAPAVIEHPTSEDQLVEIVREAREHDRRVKVVGAGHSFTPIACTDGCLVDLGNYDRVLRFDADACTVTVQAGITLAALNRELALRQMALPNLGDIAYQSAAGATATATHGTGARFGNLSTQIVGMRLIAGDGSVLECSPSENADVLDVARVGIGALGIVSTLTLQCVPSFNLHAIEKADAVDDVIDEWDELADGHDHFEFFWIPNTRIALTKRNRRTHEPVRPRPRWQAWRDDYLVSNLGLDLLCRVGRWKPALVPKVAKKLPSAGAVDYIDESYKVFASPRFVRFYEMEYAIPRDAVPEALTRVRALVDRIGLSINFPVEVRVVAADDIPLSTAYGRATGYIACHVYRGATYDQYFQGVESIMNDYDGRPHWGKMHFQTAESLAPRYPRWDDFQALRARLDPDGRFTNPYLDRVLGQTIGQG